MFLIDTSVISELRKPRPHGGVLQWFLSTRKNERALPSVALYELQAGAELTRKQNPKKAIEINSWIDGLEEEIRVIALNGDSARLAAILMNGKSPDLLEDAMIAAIAITHSLTVVTRNVRDFEQFSISLLNPFAASLS